MSDRASTKVTYRNQLSQQFEINEKRRMEQYKLTEAERRLNVDHLDQNKILLN